MSGARRGAPSTGRLSTAGLARRYDAILDCAGLGGREAGARRWRFARYVTLTTPLLRETDERGALAGGAAAAAELLRQSCAAALPRRDAWPPPHVRWAFFATSASDIELLRRLADRGQVMHSGRRKRSTLRRPMKRIRLKKRIQMQIGTHLSAS